MMSARRIVVTGMGMVTPLGSGVEVVWRRLLAGKSGIRTLSAEVCADLPVAIAGVVPDISTDVEGGFDPDKAASVKDQKKMDRFILFALAAADEAVKQAGWLPQDAFSQERTATVIGSGIGGLPAIIDAVRTTDGRGPRRLSPFTVPSFLANLAAGQISIRYGFKGPLGAPVTACAAGVQAIGDAARMIRANEIDVAICGGTDASIDRVRRGAFAAARALSTGFNDEPTRASRPFDANRDGFVMGEGAGVLVIEELEHALKRGAQPIVELVGYGTSADAYHITSGPEDGDGARRSMQLAINQAGISAGDIQHLNAHATSTPVGDRAELAAIKAIFGADNFPVNSFPVNNFPVNNKVAVTSTKSATGHLLGAAGGIEAIFTALAIRDQIVPATLNFDEADADAKGIDIVSGEARKMRIDYALSNGFGFGGVNASLLLRRWRP